MSTDTTQRRGPGALALSSALALLMLLGSGCSEKEATAPQETAPAPAAQITEPEAQSPAEAPEPAAEPEEPQAAAVDGQKIYQKSCVACHATGVANAPKLGDKAAWQPRIAKGNDAMFTSVTKGLNAMPPKGTCMSCSEDELRAAMEYMVEQGS